jgi:hypothetical protein
MVDRVRLGRCREVQVTKSEALAQPLAATPTLAYFLLPIAEKKRYGAVLLAPRRIYHHSREGGQLHCGWQCSRNGLNK